MRIRVGLLILATTSLCMVYLQPLYVEAFGAPDLYSDVDDVVRLNSTSFIPTVFHQNKNTTYMVQFYNTFCGHCQMFAPVYKDIASRLKNWTSVVRLAGVDCSKDENMITCSENKIEGYPTILIFPPNARIQDPNDAPTNLRSLNIEWTVDDIEEAIINYVANLSSTNRQYPLVVNALKPIEVTSIADFQRIYPLNHKQIDGSSRENAQDLMFIVENEKSYLGRKLIIEYFRLESVLEVRRVLITNHAFLKSIMHDTDLEKLNDSQPILLRLSHQNYGKAQVLVRGEAKHVLPTSDENEREDFIYNRFKMFFEHFYSVELKETGQSSQPRDFETLRKPSRVNNEISPKRDEELEIQYLINNDSVGSKRVFAIDLLKGISYMITHEIQIKGDLNPEEFETVRNLLTILKKYLPLEDWDTGMSQFITDLRTRLDNNRGKYEKDGVKSQEMRDLMILSGADTVRLRFKRENWMSCLESDKQHKGYTCSLWLLFHSLVAGEYAKAAPVRFHPTRVLFTMRGYITKFLGCTVCSSNFEKETESLDQSLTNRNSSVLWLWNTHNRINQRLNNEKRSAKKSLRDVIYPSHNQCPLCILEDMSEVGLDGKTLDDIRWDMASILNYLLNTYRPERIVSPKDMAKLLSRIKGKVNYDLIDVSQVKGLQGTDLNQSVEQWNIQSIFSTSDISLCLFLYLACILIVVIVCVALNPKWKRLKTK